jgi:hypothetical protein
VVWAAVITVVLIPVFYGIDLARLWIIDALQQRAVYVPVEQFIGATGIATSLFDLVQHLLGWSAAFLITSPSPGSAERYVLRRIVRVLLLIDIACWLLNLGSTFFVMDQRLILARTLMNIVATTALCLGLIAYVQSLCRRLPDQRLIRGLAWVFRSFMVASILDLLWYELDFLIAGRISIIFDRGWVWVVLFKALWPVSALLLLVSGILLIGNFVRFRRKLRELVPP